MTVGSEVVLQEAVIIVDGDRVETILAGTKGTVHRIGNNGMVALLAGGVIYPDIPIHSIKQKDSMEPEGKNHVEMWKEPLRTDLDEIKRRYPEEKPVCFNYMQAREDVFSLCKTAEKQAEQIRKLEEKSKMKISSER